jgi:transposase
MGRPKKYNAGGLTEDERGRLKEIIGTRTASAQRVRRAKILLMSFEGVPNTAIARKLDINRNTVELCLKKFSASGLETALEDDGGRGRKAVITDNDKAYVKNLACQRPYDLGYAQELWTVNLLRNHIRGNCETAGCPNLANIAKSTVSTILREAEIKPHKIRYYPEKRDPEFERKMNDVLIVYQQLEFEFETGAEPRDVTVSYDEKPGIQATANIAPDPRPAEGQGHGCVGRDYEYKRLGTVSLLAGIDLRSGEVIPLVRESHKSSDFIEFLKILDGKYDGGMKIRVILDNHSAHTSKETQVYLEKHLGRFEFIFTPKHGSWLNMIESFFGKMSRVCLRGMRVKTKEELERRIYQYFDEVNAEPVVYRWTYKIKPIKAEPRPEYA